METIIATVPSFMYFGIEKKPAHPGIVSEPRLISDRVNQSTANAIKNTRIILSSNDDLPSFLYCCFSKVPSIFFQPYAWGLKLL